MKLRFRKERPKAPTNYRGQWVEETTYEPGDVVWVDRAGERSEYRCIDAHEACVHTHPENIAYGIYWVPSPQPELTVEQRSIQLAAAMLDEYARVNKELRAEVAQLKESQ